MKILVTGSTGFIGRHVVDALLRIEDLDITVTASSSSRLNKYYSGLNVQVLPFNLYKENQGINLFKLFGAPDRVIHLAWRGLPNYGNTFHMVENLPDEVRFIKNLIEGGLKDITITGTCFEYGNTEGELLENMSCAPTNFYALAKDTLRKTLEVYQLQKPFNLKWVRLFYLYGRGQNPSSLISSLNNAISKNDLVFNMSAGMQLRDYLEVEVAAKNLVDIALQSAINGIINNCSCNPVRLIDFVNDYILERKANIKLNPGYYPYSMFEPMEFWGNNNKLKSIKADYGSFSVSLDG